MIEFVFLFIVGIFLMIIYWCCKSSPEQRSEDYTDARYGRVYTQGQIYFESRDNLTDFHGYTVAAAISELQSSLQKAQSNNRNSKGKRIKDVLIITGQGNHSAHGAPIKEAVENYLQVHGYRYVWDNPGAVRIFID